MPLNFKDIPIETTPESPFEGDRLNRANLVRSLFSLTNGLGQSGCVLAINGDWGSGKTTLIQMWKNFITQHGGKSLYFNAWETDFVNDPLIAMIGELKSVFPETSKSKALIANGSRIAAKVGGSLVKGLIKKTTGIDCDVIDSGIDEMTSICVESIQEYEKSRTDFENFKKSLREFVASETNDYPIIFFIDELDRCSPHYAIKVLERVKHLFEVPNIVFVISVNLNQLQYAVQGFYGSINIDGKEYLRRFIDLEYSLPEPDIENYVDVLFDKNEYSSFFNDKHSYNSYGRNDNEENVRYISKDLLSKSNLNLRVINKIMANFRLILYGFPANTNIPLDLVFFLCFLKILYPNIYNKIKNYEYTLQELLDDIESNLPSTLFSNDNFGFTSRHMAFAISSLLLAYNYRNRGLESEKDFKASSDDVKDATFPITPSRIDKSILYEALFYTYKSELRILMEGLNMVFERIEFINGIRF